MPRKQPLHKRLINLAINPHEGETSPHLLDLRGSHNFPRDMQIHKPLSPTLEERVAALDEKLKDMPDLLKTRAANLNQNWKDTGGALFDRAMRWAGGVQKKFNSSRARLRTLKKPALAWRARRQVLSGRHLGHVALLLILILIVTMPLQAFLLYRAINAGQAKFISHLQGSRESIYNIEGLIASKQYRNLPYALSELKNHVSGMRAIFTRLGPLRIFLPERLKTADALLRLGEGTLSSAVHIAVRAAETADNSDSAATLLRTIEREIGSLRAQLDVPKNHLPGAITQSIAPVLGRVHDLALVVSRLVASDEPRYILAVFQNPRELRATGGFAGSFALITSRNGRIESIDAPEGGTYAVQGQLARAYLSPKPLHLINPRFEFQDANWWPNFPRSARKIANLYEAAGGPTLDAVIAINAAAGEEILRLHGPLETQEGALSAENFIDVLQETIARDRAQDRRAPKKVITALLPSMQEATLRTAREKPDRFARMIFDLAERKEIQIWARDDETQAALARMEINGAFKESAGDYLAVISSNVGGGKTDGVIAQKISHQARIAEEGVERVNLTISRSHSGKRGDQFTGHRNRSYLRVYVPQGSRLIGAEGSNPPHPEELEDPSPELLPDPEVRLSEASKRTDAQSGVEIWDEDGKTVFGFWMITGPQESARVNLAYEIDLPRVGLSIPYQLIVEPQSGMPSELSSRIEFHDSWRVITANGEGEWQPQGWEFNGTLRRTLVTAGMLYKL